MPKLAGPKTSWKELLAKQGYVQLPVAHDALTAKLIELAGFPAYQVGGFAVEGTEFGYPDADLTHLGEKSACVERIIQATRLPVLVDADDGYGDAKGRRRNRWTAALTSVQGATRIPHLTSAINSRISNIIPGNSPQIHAERIVTLSEDLILNATRVNPSNIIPTISNN